MKLFWREKDYTYISGTSFEFDVPDLQNSFAVIPKDWQNEVLKDIAAFQNLVLEKQKWIEVDEHQIWRESDRAKLRDAPPNLLKMKSCKTTIFHLRKEKKSNEDLYKHEWNNQIERISNELVDYFSKLKKISSDYLEKISVIENFSWSKLESWDKQVSDHIERKKLLKLDKLSNKTFKTSLETEDCIDQIGEIVYGSFIKILNTETKNSKDKERLKRIISKRNNTILQILKQPMLPWNKDIKSINRILSFIIYEMEDNRRNREKVGYVGEQCDIFLDWRSIVEYPFESLMKCNSTKARLFILENWEKFVCLANFSNQREYRNVFGFVNRFESNTSSK